MKPQYTFILLVIVFVGLFINYKYMPRCKNKAQFIDMCTMNYTMDQCENLWNR